MKYRAEIDGLRAIAVLPVMLFHGGFNLFSGGFVGVDVFFVISGYLITTIILSEKEQGNFSLINFYDRRARRILPALFMVMLICLPFAWMLLTPTDMKEFSKSLIAVPTFLSNILFWQETDYFATATELKPLLHTWSLAVEEQYYVLFPLFLMFMWGFRRSWILGILILASLISLAGAQWAAFHYPSANFYLLLSRAWELAIGAVIAFYFLYRKDETKHHLSNKLFNEIFAFLGLAMIGFSIFTYDKSIPFPSFYALVPTIGTGMIIIFATSQTLVGRFLSAKLLVGIGLISYSAYLWHQPLLAFARHWLWEFNALTAMPILIITLIFAYLSWRLVEKPFRHNGNLGRRGIFTFALLGSFLFIAIGFFGIKTNGFESRRAYQDLLVLNYQPDNRVLSVNSWKNLRELSGDLNYKYVNNQFDHTDWFDKNDSKQRLLLVGNSHSKDMYNVLHGSENALQRFQLARFGIQIRDINETFFNSENYKQAEVIMFVSQYNKRDVEALESVVSRVIKDGKQVSLVKNIFNFKQYKNKSYNLADKLVQQMIQNKDGIPPEFISHVNNEYYMEFKQGVRKLNALRADRQIINLSQQFSSLIILDRMDYICEHETEQCFAINDKLEKYFYDYGHHTLAGAEYFGGRVDKVNWLKGVGL